MRELVVRRVHEVCEAWRKQFGVKIDLQHKPGYPVLVNHDEHTDIAARVAADVAGDGNVNTSAPPMMGAEDFAYMLEQRPGAFIFVGNGDSAGLHHPAYNFNDEAIVYGTSYWIKLVEFAGGVKVLSATLRGASDEAIDFLCRSKLDFLASLAMTKYCWNEKNAVVRGDGTARIGVQIAVFASCGMHSQQLFLDRCFCTVRGAADG